MASPDGVAVPPSVLMILPESPKNSVLSLRLLSQLQRLEIVLKEMEGKCIHKMTRETQDCLRKQKLMINGMEKIGKWKTQPENQTHFQILPVHRLNDGAYAQICPS